MRCERPLTHRDVPPTNPLGDPVGLAAVTRLREEMAKLDIELAAYNELERKRDFEVRMLGPKA